MQNRREQGRGVHFQCNIFQGPGELWRVPELYIVTNDACEALQLNPVGRLPDLRIVVRGFHRWFLHQLALVLDQLFFYGDCRQAGVALPQLVSTIVAIREEQSGPHWHEIKLSFVISSEALHALAGSS